MHEERLSISWTLSTREPYLFKTVEMLFLENNALQFFNNEMTHSPLFAHQEDIFIKFVDVKEQSLDIQKQTTSLEAEMVVLYEGIEKKNFVDSLSKVVTNEKAQKLLQTLINQGGLFDWKSKSSTIEFGHNKVSASTFDDEITAEDYETLCMITLVLVGVLALISVAILLMFAIFYFFPEKNFIKRDRIEFWPIKKSTTIETAPGSLHSSPASSFDNYIGHHRQSYDQLLSEKFPETPQSSEYEHKQFTSASTKTLRRRDRPLSFTTP